MSRYKVSKRPERPDEKMRRLFEEGAVIEMHHPAKGVRYITNTEPAIDMAKRQGFAHVEYDEEVVRKPKVAASGGDEPKPKRGPGRPRKAQSGDGGA